MTRFGGWPELMTRATAFFVLALALALLTPPMLEAAEPAAPIRVIIEMPNDDAGRAAVERMVPGHMAAENPTEPTAQPAAEVPSLALALQDLRGRLMTLAAAIPALPAQIESAMSAAPTGGISVDPVALLLAAALFVAGGFLVQRFAWWSARGLLNFILTAPSETIRERVRLHACRLSLGVLALSGFLIGSLGAFILFPWPPVFRDVVLILLSAALMLRLAVLVGRVVIAPGASLPHMRLLTLPTTLARFWYSWLIAIVAIFAAGWAARMILQTLQMPAVIVDLFVAGWLAVFSLALIVMVWSRLSRTDGPQLSRLVGVALCVSTVLSWLLWVGGLHPAFWTVIVLTLLPLVVSALRDIVHRVTQPDGVNDMSDPTATGWSVVVRQTLRNGLIVVSALLIASAWHVNLNDLAAGETLVTRLARSGIRIVIVLLVTDVIWKLASTLIDGQMALGLRSAELALHDDSPETRRRQRLNTLLPILRNVLFVVIGAVGLLMILDALGVQIGPLLAGAGVVGIAVGFGAQTLVKDIISGVFYLFDDAFRIGEYIQSSKYKGTVEGFSLRSIRLRHHRGPITIVPFGELGAVQNLSRDWVIDKFSLTVSYDSNLETVRKTIKNIGAELAADPELAPHILEPLKMQGIEQMGDYGIEVRLKVMTKPGEQFTVRRKAYAMINRIFAEKGIQLATPTVHVAGGAGDAAVAAASTQVNKDQPLPAEGEG